MTLPQDTRGHRPESLSIDEPNSQKSSHSLIVGPNYTHGWIGMLLEQPDRHVITFVILPSRFTRNEEIMEKE